LLRYFSITSPSDCQNGSTKAFSSDSVYSPHHVSKTDEEKTKWEHVMENFDMIFAQMNDISIQQHEL
jgi:hypothetical protein